MLEMRMFLHDKVYIHAITKAKPEIQKSLCGTILLRLSCTGFH
jgi:hypothetical protein